MNLLKTFVATAALVGLGLFLLPSAKPVTATPTTTLAPVQSTVCGLPDLVLMSTNTPAGPYCPKGVGYDSQCLIDCIALFHLQVNLKNNTAQDAYDDIEGAFDALESNCNSGLLTCIFEGVQTEEWCDEEYVRCMLDLCGIYVPQVNTINSNLQLDHAALVTAFYACVAACCD